MLVTSTPSTRQTNSTYLGIVMGSTVRAHLGTDILASLKYYHGELKAIQFYYHRLEKRRWTG